MWNRVAPRWFLSTSFNSSKKNIAGHQNLGDEPLNVFLLPKLFSALSLQIENPHYILLGIGSLLGIRSSCMKSNELDLPLIVFGSGYQYGKVTPIPEKSKVICVRGSATCKAYGLDEMYGVADPGILLPKYISRDVSAVPGKSARIYRWSYGLDNHKSFYNESSTSQAVKFQFINSFRSLRHFQFSDIFSTRTDEGILPWLRKLWSCEKIETESLHAAILADAYGIPWKPLGRRWGFKWHDHFSMLGITEKPRDYILTDRKNLMKKSVCLWKNKRF
ncbi:polysaccharide pyruvyl transferase family protein [Cyanothece sp. BG0011]|uniref:polysaccharide pyruvyl transferase family protein n=1 Tax=Cyanothece sp. BG0011 TaxID=2082950 RepID=UPI000D1F6BEE|nr:polysaccharide pyruvyl transferase family protein [Cyanothece sp. BG0011]